MFYPWICSTMGPLLINLIQTYSVILKSAWIYLKETLYHNTCGSYPFAEGSASILTYIHDKINLLVMNDGILKKLQQASNKAVLWLTY